MFVCLSKIRMLKLGSHEVMEVGPTRWDSCPRSNGHGRARSHSHSVCLDRGKAAWTCSEWANACKPGGEMTLEVRLTGSLILDFRDY